MTFTILEMKMK